MLCVFETLVQRGHDSCRAYSELRAENTSLAADKQELTTQVGLLTARLNEGLAKVQHAEQNLTQAEAQLDRKRQKKRAHKANATKFQQLWRQVCPRPPVFGVTRGCRGLVHVTGPGRMPAS